jgi:hypothetical protein
MSATTSCAKAANIATIYEVKGFNDIEVLCIKVDESEWPRESTIWHVKETAAKLGLTMKTRYFKFDETEYLVKDCIPASCVDRRVGWKQMKAEIRAETAELAWSRKRKWRVLESDCLPHEPVLTVPSRRRWGLVERRCRGRPYYIET